MRCADEGRDEHAWMAEEGHRAPALRRARGRRRRLVLQSRGDCARLHPVRCEPADRCSGANRRPEARAPAGRPKSGEAHGRGGAAARARPRDRDEACSRRGRPRRAGQGRAGHAARRQLPGRWGADPPAGAEPVPDRGARSRHRADRSGHRPRDRRPVERAELDLAFAVEPLRAGPFETQALLLDPFLFVVPAGRTVQELASGKTNGRLRVPVVCFRSARRPGSC